MKATRIAAIILVVILMLGCSLGSTRVEVENRTEFDLELIDGDIEEAMPVGETVVYFVPNGERWIFVHGTETRMVWTITYEAKGWPLFYYAATE